MIYEILNQRLLRKVGLDFPSRQEGLEIMAQEISRAERLREQFLEWAEIIDNVVTMHKVSMPVNQSVSIHSGGIIAETERVAIDIISSVGHAMPTRDLLKAIKKRGVRVGGVKPVSTLSSRLRNASHLRRTDQGWSVK